MLLKEIITIMVGLMLCEAKNNKMNYKSTFTKLHRSHSEIIHEVAIVVTLLTNQSKLHEILMERSAPGSLRYQQWLTLHEVGELTQNDEAVNSITNWLSISNITVTNISKHGHYIYASASIRAWEKLLDTTFHYWKDVSDENVIRYYHRSESYKIPNPLSAHIQDILKTCQIPVIPKLRGVAIPLSEFQKGNRTKSNLLRSDQQFHLESCSSNSPCDTTVSQIDSIYGINNNIADLSLSQAVFQTNSESFSQTDLNLFQSAYSIPLQAANVYGTTASSSCAGKSCIEGSLDIQYIMGLAQEATGIFWYQDPNSGTGDPIIDFLINVYNSDNPPSSLSISWGTDESNLNKGNFNLFNERARLLGLIGVTIFVASGDDGVSGGSCRCPDSSSSSSTAFYWTGAPWSGNGYFPDYPASSPYVVAVGATMGPETGVAEKSCQSQSPHRGVITSGGGFSTYNQRPSYQNSAVASYLSGAAGSAAATGFNPNGRGYPDVSFMGVQFPVIITGNVYMLYGTSASTPLAAAMITLLNSERKKLGYKGTVGFINPTLYANASLFNDISSGHNKCCKSPSQFSTPTCCTAGFSAAAGWDPVTGLGSIQFENLGKMLISKNFTYASSTKNVESSDSGSSLDLIFIFVIGVAAVLGCALLLLIIFCFCFQKAPELAAPALAHGGGY